MRKRLGSQASRGVALETEKTRPLAGQPTRVSLGQQSVRLAADLKLPLLRGLELYRAAAFASR
jgi:hypothetical protein